MSEEQACRDRRRAIIEKIAAGGINRPEYEHPDGGHLVPPELAALILEQWERIDKEGIMATFKLDIPECGDEQNANTRKG